MTELEDKIKYLNDLRAERVKRPATKTEYIALLAKTEQDIKTLIDAQNAAEDKKRADEEAARLAEIEAASLEPTPPTIDERIDAMEDVLSALLEG